MEMDKMLVSKVFQRLMKIRILLEIKIIIMIRLYILMIKNQTSQIMRKKTVMMRVQKYWELISKILITKIADLNKVMK